MPDNFIVVRDGRKVEARTETRAQALQLARGLIEEHPRTTYEVAKLTRRFSSVVSPPSFTPVEEDLEA